MPSSELDSLRQQLHELQRRNTTLEQQLVQQRTLDEDFYRFLFDTMDEGFCVIEFFDGPHGPLSDYIHVLANAAYAQHAGIPDVVGQKLREMVPDEADEWVARYGAVLRTGQPLHFEQELVATGRVLSVTTFRIEPAERRQVAVLFKDVTERRRAEDALQQLNEELEQRVRAAIAERQLFARLVDSSVACVQVVDNDLRWQAINQQSLKDFQYLYDHVPRIGESVADALRSNPSDCARGLALWRRALAGEAFTESAEFGSGERRRHYELRFNTLHDDNGGLRGAYLFAYDIQTRIEEQQRLLRAEEALRQAQKMEAVGQLTGGIAHDFNNLLGGILGAHELMRQRLQQERHDDVGPLLDAASSSAQRAASLVHRLLAFSRQQTLQPQATQVDALVRDMQELICRSVGPAIEVRSHFANDLWPTFIDPPQLESALLNLCINARDALPSGGTIDIHSANIVLDDEQGRSLDLAAGDYLRLSVEDNGLGMAADVAARAIDPFFTTKPLGQGTGLGLSMAFGFVRQSGGQLRIVSTPGLGTRIELYLPRHHQVQEPEQPRPGELPATLHGQGVRIVLVEDQQTLRMVISEVLEESGYRVEIHESAVAALPALQNGPAPGLLISDIGLPGGMNGRQLAEAMRQIHPYLPVLFITGYDESAALSDGQLAPGMSVMTKPFGLEALLLRVEQMLGEHG
ncbi:PAS domain-containing protein [Pseudomonas sp. 148P]|uniref:histidine kinase n=1 Tax=Pseudomonas ulcerans TaxID=3115852 RepID=A0ABU7HZC6_9PSED|nr:MULTISPECIES: PAS domain-containing protein [unclassified Pseudomonas]MEE1925366.1 PAS domain-containing protein [Pseudomonas sp. 147P]MEE1936836.1 PAS domain-containing protein [Pseudomonas sp. 148P]